MDETELKSRIAALLEANPPASTDRLDFLHARFDAGLAWVHFPEGLGGLGLPRGMQPIVEKALYKAGAPDNDPRKIGIGLGMAAPTILAFGRPISNQGVVRDWIAESRVRIEQLRLLVLKTAWLMDTVGNRGAHTEIQAIKIATPQTVQWILDKAIQVHGAGGLSQDFPLAASYAGIRTLRFADGPDEVHKNSLAKTEIARHTSDA